jgi:hypothetical protein
VRESVGLISHVNSIGPVLINDSKERILVIRRPIWLFHVFESLLKINLFVLAAVILKLIC